jgi:hypothetical protein
VKALKNNIVSDLEIFEQLRTSQHIPAQPRVADMIVRDYIRRISSIVSPIEYLDKTPSRACLKCFVAYMGAFSDCKRLPGWWEKTYTDTCIRMFKSRIHDEDSYYKPKPLMQERQEFKVKKEKKMARAQGKKEKKGPTGASGIKKYSRT